VHVFWTVSVRETVTLLIHQDIQKLLLQKAKLCKKHLPEAESCIVCEQVHRSICSSRKCLCPAAFTLW